jgi:hypothetical protein
MEKRECEIALNLLRRLGETTLSACLNMECLYHAPDDFTCSFKSITIKDGKCEDFKPRLDDQQ